MQFPIGQRVMVRTESAGVFAAILRAVDGDVAQLGEARRIHYWRGAASLSELAVRGTSDPNGCRFPVAVPELTVRGWIEFIPISEAAGKTIDSVPVWTA